MGIVIYLSTFIAVFLLNIIPFIGPPTWMILSFVAFFFPIPSAPLFILTALIAATCGRAVLTSFSKYIVRDRWLAQKYKKNLDNLRKHLQKKPLFTSLVFLLEAITPISSDELFIAFGLTGLELRYALIPFFIGRIFTYSFWVYATIGVSQSVNSILNLSFLTIPFALVSLAFVLLIYFFVKVDWEYLFIHRKLKLIK